MAKRSERTTWEWEYAVREHDGKVTSHGRSSSTYGNAERLAADSANRINHTVVTLRLDLPPAVVLRRKVTTTVVTTVAHSGWEQR